MARPFASAATRSLWEPLLMNLRTTPSWFSASGICLDHSPSDVASVVISMADMEATYRREAASATCPYSRSNRRSREAAEACTCSV